MAKKSGDRRVGDDARGAGVESGAAPELLERISDGFAAVDTDWRITYVNSRAEQLVEANEEELLGQNLWEAFPEAVDLKFYEQFHHAMESQEAVSFEEYYPPLSSWFWVKAYPSESGLSVYFEDVSDQRIRQQVVDTVWDAVYATDPDERFVMVNDAFVEMSGYEREELLGEHVSLVHSEEVSEEAQELAQEVAEGKREAAVLETDLRTKSGETIPVEAKFGPFEHGDDEFGRTGVIRDISQRKQRERELHRTEDRFRKVFEQSHDAIYITDPHADEIIDVNPAALEMLGYTREELLSMGPSDCHPDEMERFRAFVDEVFDAGTGWTDELTCLTKSGERLPVEMTASRIEIDGQPLMLANVRDISQRKERERELERIERQFEATFENPLAFMALLDPDGTLQRVNDTAMEFVDADREAVLGEPFPETPWWDHSEELQAELCSRIERAADGEYHRVEVEHRNGEETITVDSLLQPVHDGDDEVVAILASGRDITQRKEREEALRRLHEVNQRFPETETPECVADMLVEATADVLDLSGSAVYLHREGGLVPVATGGPLSAAAAGLSAVSATDPRGPLGRAYQEGETVVRQDVGALESPIFAEGRLRRGVFVPLGEHGVLVAGSSETGAFTEPTVELAELLAGTAESHLNRIDREQSLERYVEIVESVEDGVFVVDDDWEFRTSNETFREFVGTDRENLRGTPARAVLDGEFVDRVQEAAAESDEEGLELEYEFPGDGEPLTAECLFAPFPPDESYDGLVCVVRDVTDQKKRQQRLQKRVAQQRRAAEFGQSALRNPDLDALFQEAVDLLADTLDVEYAAVLEHEPGRSRLVRRATAGFDDPSGTALELGGDTQAERVLTENTAIVVRDRDAEQRFETQPLFEEHGVRSGISVPIGSGSPWGVLGAHSTEPQGFDEHDATFVQNIANTLMGVIERNRHERALISQGEQLAALNQLNTIVREINHAVAEQSTREEIERLVCERLAETSSYEFAWIGEVNQRTGEIDAHVEVGAEGYTEEITVTVDESPTGAGPGGKAIRTGETQVVQRCRENFEHEHWRELAEEYGFRSIAAVPVRYDEALYGVLGIYSARRDAFTGEELDVLDDLGEIIGHALQSIERKRMLMSDDVVEIELRMRNVTELPFDDGEQVVFDRAVPADDERFLVYGRCETDPEKLESLVEEFDHFTEISLLDEEGEATRFVCELDHPPTLSTVASHGGRVRRAAIEGNDYRMTIELPPDVEPRTVLEPIRENYPDLETIAQKRITADDRDIEGAVSVPTMDLTERQQAVLEASYFGGYFEWPRKSSAEEIADRMDISAPTFHEHLRRAQRKVFESMLSE